MTLRFTTAIAFAVAAVSSFAWQGSSQLLPKVSEEMTKCESAMMEGRYAEAEAYAALASKSTYAVDVDYSAVSADRMEEVKKTVADALDTWTKSTGGTIVFKASEPGMGDVKLKFADRVFYVGNACAGRAVWVRTVHNWGNDIFTPEVTGTITIGLNTDALKMKSTLLHEFGHMLGLKDGGKGVMGVLNPINPTIEPSQDEIDALVSVREEANAMALRCRVK